MNDTPRSRWNRGARPTYPQDINRLETPMATSPTPHSLIADRAVALMEILPEPEYRFKEDLAPLVATELASRGYGAYDMVYYRDCGLGVDSFFEGILDGFHALEERGECHFI